jgi:hypothetical protein
VPVSVGRSVTAPLPGLLKAPAAAPPKKTAAPSPPSASAVPSSKYKVSWDKSYVRGKNNNPTNLKYGALTKKWVDAGTAEKDTTPALDGGHFLRFKSIEDGLSAAKDLLQSSGYKDATVDKALRKWSNDAYDTGALKLKELGSKTVADLNNAEMETLVKAMAHWESGFKMMPTPMAATAHSGGRGGR